MFILGAQDAEIGSCRLHALQRTLRLYYRNSVIDAGLIKCFSQLQWLLVCSTMPA